MVHLIAPDDFDPDDALEARYLREHDGASEMEIPHPEEEARDIVMREGHWLPVSHATLIFTSALLTIQNGENDATPY